MSLALPTNIAGRQNVDGILCDLLRSLTGPVTFHVCDGKFAGHTIQADEFFGAAKTIADCRFV
jgi:hypothetical protein